MNDKFNHENTGHEVNHRSRSFTNKVYITRKQRRKAKNKMYTDLTWKANVHIAAEGLANTAKENTVNLKIEKE